MRQETWNWIVPEGLWEIPKPLLPPSRVRPQGGGTPDTPDETLFAAIIYVLVSGCAWRQLPCSTPPQPPTNATPPTTWPSSASQPPCAATSNCSASPHRTRSYFAEPRPLLAPGTGDSMRSPYTCTGLVTGRWRLPVMGGRGLPHHPPQLPSVDWSRYRSVRWTTRFN